MEILTCFLQIQIPGHLHEACRSWEDTVFQFVDWLDAHPLQEGKSADVNAQEADIDSWYFGDFKEINKLRDSSNRIRRVEEADSDVEVDVFEGAPNVSFQSLTSAFLTLP